MNELDIIKHARGYLDLLSKGYNPITKEKYSENSDFNNERLIKCFSFVTEILDRVIIAETKKNTDATNVDATKETNKSSIKSENIKPEESYNEELLYNPSALVSDDVDGADVVKTLIEKGLLKQGITNNPKRNNS